MNLDGTELKFEVKKYHPSTKNNWDCEWCQIFVSVHSKYIHYEMDGETLLCCEIEEIHTKLKDALAGENTGRQELSFVEPDYEMVIEVYKDKNVMVDWIFHLWDEEDTLSANSFTISAGYRGNSPDGGIFGEHCEIRVLQYRGRRSTNGKVV